MGAEAIKAFSITVVVLRETQSQAVGFKYPSDAVRWLEDQGYLRRNAGDQLVDNIEMGNIEMGD